MVPGQGVTCLQNERAAARSDALTHLLIWGSRTPALCPKKTTKLHNLPGKATGLDHRAMTSWSITRVPVIRPQQKEQSHISMQRRKSSVVLNIDRYCQINMLNNHATNLKTHKVVLKST